MAMITRREHHRNFGIKDRVSKLISRIVNKADLPSHYQLPITNLKFEKWKCEPLHNGQKHFITVCNDDIKESLRGIELLNGKVIEMIKKSDDEYKIRFKNNRVYKLIKYI